MRLIFILIILLVLGSFSISALLHDGFFDFHDNTQVVRVYEMGLMLSEGIFPVRWVPDLGYGYGYPIFNFYGPLPYYIGGGFNSIGFDALMSTKIMFGLGILLSSFSMFFLAKRFFGNAAAILSATVYLYFPYHAVNIYVRGAVGEFFAYAFLPILFLGIFQLLEFKKIKSNLIYPFATITIGTFLVATSHNLTIFMSLIIICPIFLAGLFLAKSGKLFFFVVLSALVYGFFLAAFYVLPAFWEMKFANVSSQIGGGADFKEHYVCIGQYWDSMWGYGGSTHGCNDGFSFKLGKSNILMLASVIVMFLYSLLRKQIKIPEKVMILSLVGLLFGIFLSLSLSHFVWDSIPFMQYIQYPWRFNNFIGLFMALIIGYFAFFLRKYMNIKATYVVLSTITLLTIVINAKLFEPQSYNLNDANFYTRKEYINFTVSKISDEYLPIGFVKPRQLSELPKNDVEVYKTSGRLDLELPRYDHLRIKYFLPHNGVIHINRAFYPSWEARINGKNVPIIPAPDGMNILVDRGNGLMDLRMESTTIQSIGNIFTVVAFLTLSTVIIVFLRKKNSS